jgi:hypothetical protein
MSGACAIYVLLLNRLLNLIFLGFAPRGRTGALFGMYFCARAAQTQGGKNTHVFSGRVPTEEAKGSLMLRKTNERKPAQKIVKID